MTTLDRNKPFATVINDDAGRAYEQGGRYFRNDGSLWVDPDAPAAAPAAKKPASKSVPAAPANPADDQLAAQLGSA